MDVSENLAGPFCTQILGDLGAEVVKVERPAGGDPARAWGPPFWGGESPLFLAGNRNKRSLAVDLKSEEGREVVRRLVGRADVFVQSWRRGVARSLGLAPDPLRRAHPRLVYCSVTAFGTRGPMRDLPGYDPLLQAYGGLMSVTGHPDREPVRVGTSVMDMSTGMWAALGILAALRRREETGEGSHVTTALFDSAVVWISYHLLGYLGTGHVPAKAGSGLGMIVPYEAFPTADGHVMVAAGNDGLFRSLCESLGIPEVADDPRFRDNPARVAHREALYRILAGATRALRTAEAERRLRDAGVPIAPIRSVDEVARDPQVAANGMLVPTPHATIRDFRSVALPVEWDGRRATSRRGPPLPGEHTREILEEAGYGEGELEEFAERGVVGGLSPERASAPADR